MQMLRLNCKKTWTLSYSNAGQRHHFQLFRNVRLNKNTEFENSHRTLNYSKNTLPNLVDPWIPVDGTLGHRHLWLTEEQALNVNGFGGVAYFFNGGAHSRGQVWGLPAQCSVPAISPTVGWRNVVCGIKLSGTNTIFGEQTNKQSLITTGSWLAGPWSSAPSRSLAKPSAEERDPVLLLARLCGIATKTHYMI